jgi:hypothetical protein
MSFIWCVHPSDPVYPVCSRPFMLGAPGRSGQFFQAPLCAHSEWRGRQSEPVFEILPCCCQPSRLEGHRNRDRRHASTLGKIGRRKAEEHICIRPSVAVRTSCLLVNVLVPDVSLYRLLFVYVGQSQHVKGERAQALGWEPKTVPVEFEQWAEDGIKVALEKLQN